MSSLSSRELDRLERASEGVVVGDRDPSEPDLLGVVEKICHRNRAVVRPVRVHVEIDDDPVPVFERIAGSGRLPTVSALSRQPRVERGELLRDDIEALALGTLPASSRGAVAKLLVFGESRNLERDAVGIVAALRDCDSGRSGLQCQPGLAVGSGHEDRRLGECRGTLLWSPRKSDVRALANRARNGRTESERLRVEERQLPVGQVAEQPRDRAGHAASGRLELDRDHFHASRLGGRASYRRRSEPARSRPRSALRLRRPSLATLRGARRLARVTGRAGNVAVDRRDGPERRRSPPSARGSRSVRDRRGSEALARSRARRRSGRGRVRGADSRARPPGRPCSCGGRSGSTGRPRSPPRRSLAGAPAVPRADRARARMGRAPSRRAPAGGARRQSPRRARSPRAAATTRTA